VIFGDRSDDVICKRMGKRYREIAGMFKEIGKGTYNEYHKIIGRFAAQEGIRRTTAKEYGETLLEIGLLIMKKGSGDWYYNEDAEWEQFKINI